MKPRSQKQDALRIRVDAETFAALKRLSKRVVSVQIGTLLLESPRKERMEVKVHAASAVKEGVLFLVERNAK